MAVRYQDFGDGIYCVDTGLYRPQMAACYLLRSGDAVAFIDTGTYHTVPLLLELLSELGLGTENVQYVIPTHVHLDHAGGAGELMARCPNASMIVHPKGGAHMIDPSKLQAGATAVYGEEGFARDYGRLVAVPGARVISAADGQEFDLNGRALIFADTPGHANHHGCIFDVRTRSWFTGDTFGISYREFDGAKGEFLFAPTTPVAFEPDVWRHSLDKLMSYEPSAVFLTHYARLKEPQRLVSKLRDSIETLEGVALELQNQAEGRLDILRQQVGELLTQQARLHKPEMPEEEIRVLLAVDIDLNAQGLDVWLQRRAKAAARASITKE